jgi:hypothetical protein
MSRTPGGATIYRYIYPCAPSAREYEEGSRVMAAEPLIIEPPAASGVRRTAAVWAQDLTRRYGMCETAVEARRTG